MYFKIVENHALSQKISTPETRFAETKIFFAPLLVQHAHMLQIAETHVSQSHCSRIPRKRVPQETIPLVANGVALPATFRHVTSQQGSHLSPHVPCNVRTCYWLRRLVFQALSLHLRPCL